MVLSTAVGTNKHEKTKKHSFILTLNKQYSLYNGFYCSLLNCSYFFSGSTCFYFNVFVVFGRQLLTVFFILISLLSLFICVRSIASFIFSSLPWQGSGQERWREQYVNTSIAFAVCHSIMCSLWCRILCKAGAFWGRRLLSLIYQFRNSNSTIDYYCLTEKSAYHLNLRLIWTPLFLVVVIIIRIVILHQYLENT